MDPSVTLWQFVLQLPREQGNGHICWTSRDSGEFKLVDAEEAGLRKNKSIMNYDKNIIRKESGQKLVYKSVAGCSTEDCPPQPAVSVTSAMANVAPAAVPAAPGNAVSGKPGTPKAAGRAGPGGLARSSRNKHLRSGLSSTRTIQSLQPQPPPRPRPAVLLPSAAPAGAAAPPGSRSPSPSCLQARLEAEEARLPLQVILTRPEAPNLKSEELNVELVEGPKEESEVAGERGFVPETAKAEPRVPPREGVPAPGGHAASSPEVSRPQKGRKPRDLELPLSPSLLGGPGPERTPGLETGSGLPAPRPASLPPSFHFWSTPGPTAPRSPAKLSCQLPCSDSAQVHIPSISVDGLSTRWCSPQGPRSRDYHHHHHHPFWGHSILALLRRNSSPERLML
uniref:ETS domain-containing protein n=1 Tax=Cercocebus atys TaxID=9531 RepID=A0A2K5LWV6_CERAT